VSHIGRWGLDAPYSEMGLDAPFLRWGLDAL